MRCHIPLVRRWWFNSRPPPYGDQENKNTPEGCPLCGLRFWRRNPQLWGSCGIYPAEVNLNSLTPSGGGIGFASPCPSLMVMNKIARHRAGLKPCSYDPGRSSFRSCRPLGLPGKGNQICRFVFSMPIRLGSCANRGVQNLPIMNQLRGTAAGCCNKSEAVVLLSVWEHCADYAGGIFMRGKR